MRHGPLNAVSSIHKNAFGARTAFQSHHCALHSQSSQFKGFGFYTDSGLLQTELCMVCAGLPEDQGFGSFLRGVAVSCQ